MVDGLFIINDVQLRGQSVSRTTIMNPSAVNGRRCVTLDRTAKRKINDVENLTTGGPKPCWELSDNDFYGSLKVDRRSQLKRGARDRSSSLELILGPLLSSSSRTRL